MKLERLISIASSAYPDDLIQQYFEKPKERHGDTLAEFIAVELVETYDEEVFDDADQLAAAVQQLRTARDELDAVIGALEEAQ